jgi:Ca-activated chloride channel family protein
MARSRFAVACLSAAALLTHNLFAQQLARISLPTTPDVALRADASLVVIPAHVTTLTGASVTTLHKEDFRILENDAEQTIASFAQDDAPVSIGFLFDTSGSMLTKMPKALEAAAALFKTANEDDEFFLVQFSNGAKVSVPYTQDSSELYDRMSRIRPFGMTALLDAIHLGLTQMKKAHHLRKALVILSDGGDNWSRRTTREVKRELQESDVQVYAMGIFDPNLSKRDPEEERNGPRLLSELAEQSGGREYPVDNLTELPAISTRIGNELRSQYLLGYYPTGLTRDGKFHEVTVKLTNAGDKPMFRTYYRRGYYAATE